MAKIALFLACSLMLILALSQYAPPAWSQPRISYQIGAWGDDASRGNLGASVEIQTHTYSSYSGVFDYFWVGDNLVDGSFIQFGYGLEPGSYCLKGSLVGGKSTCLGSSALIADSDARWQWQYWPNREGSDFYYQIGPAASAGENGTWHSYAVVPGSNDNWAFRFDNITVANLNVHPQESSDPVFAVAEKSSSSNITGTLGPTEFRNLSYLDSSGWHSVTSLISLSSCNQTPMCTENPYGITRTLQGYMIAGSGQPGTGGESLLWTSSFVTLKVETHGDVEFHITTFAGSNTYRGNAVITVPKGMYAYVTLRAESTPTEGPLGYVGAYEQFMGWTGAVNSNNSTVRILMSSNEQISATWATRVETPIAVAVSAVAVVVISLVIRSKWKRAGENASSKNYLRFEHDTNWSENLHASTVA